MPQNNPQQPHNLRLTLRTLLSYLDDTLEPAQAKIIGQKVAESEQARELIERIREATRRRKLTTPPAAGPGGFDPNTIAEYLDNEVTPDQATEVEQICLASDVHLAEVAACHQILTLVLGEPALVPPSAKQRMYALVKGPEAIHSRKPPRTPREADQDLSSEIHPDADETLRLGVPPAGKGNWRNPLLLIGGGVIAACLLAVALFQLFSPPRDPDVPPNGGQVAQGDGKDKVAPPDDQDLKKKQAAEAEEKQRAEEKRLAEQKRQEEEKAKIALEKKKQEEDAKKVEVPPPPPDMEYGPPDQRIIPVGKAIPTPPKELAVLMQAGVKPGEWKRVEEKKDDVVSGRPLLALPGSRAAIALKKNVRLMLWGNQPEVIPAPLYESSVTIHAHDKLAADMTLRRGRIVLTNQGEKDPPAARVRFEDPKRGKEMHFDITLLTPDASVLVERWSYFSFDEPFYDDPKHANRVGPTAQVHVAVLAGAARVQVNDVTYTMSAPPGHFLMSWNSVKGGSEPQQQDMLPAAYRTDAPPSKDLDQKARTAALKAYENLARAVQTKPLEVALAEMLASNEVASHRLAVRCYAAMDNLESLLDTFQETSPLDVRLACVESLRHWVALERDNDYRLLDALKTKYKAVAAQRIVELLHYVPPAQLNNPATYERLIDDLDNPLYPIRELSAWHLYQLVRSGQKIRYGADAPKGIRQDAQLQWRRLIPRGQLPPMPSSKKS